MWAKHLEDYYKQYGSFLVQKLDDYPHPWVHYGTKEYDEFIKEYGYVTQREVLPDEIVADIDMHSNLNLGLSRAESQQMAKILSNRLCKDKQSHKVFNSGGSGTHVHWFCKQLLYLKEEDRNLMRKCLLRHYARGLIKSPRWRGSVQLQSIPLIQIEDSKNRKGGKKKMLYEHSFPNNNFIPDVVWKAYNKRKEEFVVEKQVLLRRGKDDKPEIISFFESERFANIKDGRERALFILTAYHKQYMTPDDLFDYLSLWNKNLLGEYFSSKDIKTKIRYAKPCLAVSYAQDLLDDLGVKL